MILTNARQINLAKEALEILKDVKIALNNNDPIDLIEIDLKNIYEKTFTIQLLKKSYI